MMTYNKGMLVRAQNKFGTFANEMINLIENDQRVCYIACDTTMENSNLREAMKKYPNRIIDVGIAEGNAVDLAVGMALSGKIPYVVTVSSFIVLKTLEQIHTNIAYCDVPVRMVATNSGTTAGPTHDAICDINILNSIPNLYIIIPSCIHYLIKAINQTINFRKPIFFKIPQYQDDNIFKYYKKEIFEIGKAMTIRNGNDVAIMGIGAGVTYAFKAAQALEKFKIEARVIDIFFFKPIDREIIIKAAKETGYIITVEEQNIQNGLGTVVSSILVEERITCKVVKLGIPDEFMKNSNRNSDHYKYNDEDIVKIIKDELL